MHRPSSSSLFFAYKYHRNSSFSVNWVVPICSDVARPLFDAQIKKACCNKERTQSFAKSKLHSRPINFLSFLYRARRVRLTKVSPCHSRLQTLERAIIIAWNGLFWSENNLIERSSANVFAPSFRFSSCHFGTSVGMEAFHNFRHPAHRVPALHQTNQEGRHRIPFWLSSYTLHYTILSVSSRLWIIPSLENSGSLEAASF